MAMNSASSKKSPQKALIHSGGDTSNGVGWLVTSDSPEKVKNTNITTELDSRNAIPYQWEQFLDLEAREIYYTNQRDGKGIKEEPRDTTGISGDVYSKKDGEYDTYGIKNCYSTSYSRESYHEEDENVLVVAGCKTCYIYQMLPKSVEKCPKCNSLLLHFH